MSREHVTPKATGWAYGLTEPAVVEVEDALQTLQWMWDYCDDIKRNHRSFGGNDMVMRQWSKALTVIEKMAAKYLDREGPPEPITHEQAIQLWHLAGEAHNRTSAFEWFSAGILAAELFHKVITPAADTKPIPSQGTKEQG